MLAFHSAENNSNKPSLHSAQTSLDIVRQMMIDHPLAYKGQHIDAIFYLDTSNISFQERV
jgi:hypothetical protein